MNYDPIADKPFPTLLNDNVLRAARGQKTDRVPVWVMRQAGRYLPEYLETRKGQSFTESVQNPEICCELTLQPIRRFDLDAAIIFSDILVVNEALGINFELVPNEGIKVLNPLKSVDDLERLRTNVDIRKELHYVFEAISLTRHKLDGKVPLFGFSGAPWTLMTYMVENGSAQQKELAKKWLYAEPEASAKLLQIITDVVISYLTEQVVAGAQILQVFESHAGCLSYPAFCKFSLPYLRKIAEGVKKNLENRKISPVPMVVFAKDAHHSIEDLSASGYDVVGLDWGIKPKNARRLAGASVTLQGNLDPCALFASKEEIAKMARDMVDRFGTQRYIANLGHGIHRFTNPDHLEAFVDAIHAHSSQDDD
ncbi:uroporphyrinogen decarboxylase-like [Lineus longissimus]|uniref:uroporphyrinogen decarboxylase-like n=1 Tax=Lineus longissimus TaxID=88925 RepID=UPI002B4D5987